MGVNFNVSKGEAVGILGNNGMGKTTLLKSLAGLLKAEQGIINFAGLDITTLPSHKRNLSGVGYVSQSRDIFPNLTVRENLRTGILMHESSRKRENEILDEILLYLPRLKPLLERSGGVLSGGEQQILALARCLCGSPSLLLLDEPTEGIQPSIVDEISEVLNNLRLSKKLTIVLVEQNLEFVADVAQRVYIIRRGILTGQLLPGQLDDPEVIDEFIGIT